MSVSLAEWLAASIARKRRTETRPASTRITAVPRRASCAGVQRTFAPARRQLGRRRPAAHGSAAHVDGARIERGLDRRLSARLDDPGGRPEDFDLALRDSRIEARQAAGRGNPHALEAAAAAGSVGGRPDDQLLVVDQCVFGVDCPAHDPACWGRPGDQPPVVRPLDQVKEMALLGRREKRLGARLVGIAPGDRQAPVEALAGIGQAVEEAVLRVAEQGSLQSARPDPDGVVLLDLHERAAGGGQHPQLGIEGLGEGQRDPTPADAATLRPAAEGVRADKPRLDRQIGQCGRAQPAVDEAGSIDAAQRRRDEVGLAEAAIREERQAGGGLLVEDPGDGQLDGGRVAPIEGRVGIPTVEGREHRLDRTASTALARNRARLTHRLHTPVLAPIGAGILGHEMKTILVVDDERNIVELLRLYLEKEGWAVITAADGEEGLALHARHDPDLVILDLMLPKVDGFEVCRELRRRGDVPIVMLTARDDVVDSIVGLELGADDYVAEAVQPPGPGRPDQGDLPADRGDRPGRPADRGRRACGSIPAGGRRPSGHAGSSCAPASSTCWRPWPATPASC